MTKQLYDAYAIYSDRPTDLGAATEMGPGLVPRAFTHVCIEYGQAISRDMFDFTRIRLIPGTYRISGFSILTMDIPGQRPNLNPYNKYGGYCCVYDAAHPPESEADMDKCIAVGSINQAFDTSPSLFDAVYTCTAIPHTDICVGHQCSYVPTQDQENKVYIRVATRDSLVHDFARISIFKIG
jgi:hypothetical protein